MGMVRSVAGSVIRTGEGRYRVQVEATVNGERVRRSKVVRGTAREAELIKLKMLSELGTAPTHDMTLGDYIQTVYLPDKLQRLRLSTYETYASRCRTFLVPGLGYAKLSSINPAMVSRWLSKIDGDKRRREAKRMLSMVVRHAVSNGTLRANPLGGMGHVMADVHKPQVIDAEDIEVYLWHFKGTIAEPQVLLALGGGFRRSEICALDVGDVDPETGIVTIDDAIVAAGEKHMHRERTKTANGTRQVVLPPSFLRRLLEVMPESGPICNHEGKRLHPQYISTQYRRCLSKMPEGVPRVPLRNLRHSSLTLAYDAGADIVAVSRRAGHSSPYITTKYYVRPQGARDRQTAEMMEKALH